MKVIEPNYVETQNILRDFMNININNSTPGSNVNGKPKLIKDCTYEEILKILFSDKFINIGERWLKTLGDPKNLMANAFKNMTNRQNEEIRITQLYVLSLIMLLAKQEEHYTERCTTTLDNNLQWEKFITNTIEDLQNNLDIEKTKARNKAKQIGHKDLAVADKAYFNGQQDMLNKLQEVI